MVKSKIIVPKLDTQEIVPPFKNNEAKKHSHILESATREVSGNLDFMEEIVNIERFNPALLLHGLKVSSLSVSLGIMLGLSDGELFNLGVAGFLHDIGKIYIPEEIIDKQGPLNNEEWGNIKMHPSVGHSVIRVHFPELITCSEGVLHHHEKWDGSGYPFGYKRESIPLLGRILSITDAYDTMRSERSYKAAKPLKLTLSIIKEDAGTHFDPEVVRMFMHLFF